MKPTMTRLLALAVLVTAAACSHHLDLGKASTQANFGVQMARMDLWREAMFRFRRAVEINPDDAMARNNLAVAYEANGDFEKARKEYLEALKLDRSNTYIQKNYSRFVEFLSRNRKRQPQRAESLPRTQSTTAPQGKVTEVTPEPPAGSPVAAEPVKPAPAPGTPPSDLPGQPPTSTAPPPPAPPPQPPPGAIR